MTRYLSEHQAAQARECIVSVLTRLGPLPITDLAARALHSMDVSVTLSDMRREVTHMVQLGMLHENPWGRRPGTGAITQVISLPAP